MHYFTSSCMGGGSCSCTSPGRQPRPWSCTCPYPCRHTRAGARAYAGAHAPTQTRTQAHTRSPRRAHPHLAIAPSSSRSRLSNSARIWTALSVGSMCGSLRGLAPKPPVSASRHDITHFTMAAWSTSCRRPRR
eukprot:57245-Chlamydomonas_euryale.AAC.6